MGEAMNADRLNEEQREAAIEAITDALGKLPLARYDDLTKLAERGLGDLLAALDDAEQRAAQAEQERDEAVFDGQQAVIAKLAAEQERDEWQELAARLAEEACGGQARRFQPGERLKLWPAGSAQRVWLIQADPAA